MAEFPVGLEFPYRTRYSLASCVGLGEGAWHRFASLRGSEGKVAQTAIDLDEDQARLLRDFSATQGRSVGDVVCEAVSEYLARRGAMEPRAIAPRRRIPDDEWRSGFEAALQRLRAGVDPNWSPEEIEADITAAREEVRRERAARRHRSGG